MNPAQHRAPAPCKHCWWGGEHFTHKQLNGKGSQRACGTWSSVPVRIRPVTRPGLCVQSDALLPELCAVSLSAFGAPHLVLYHVPAHGLGLQ